MLDSNMSALYAEAVTNEPSVDYSGSNAVPSVFKGIDLSAEITGDFFDELGELYKAYFDCLDRPETEREQGIEEFKKGVCRLRDAVKHSLGGENGGDYCDYCFRRFIFEVYSRVFPDYDIERLEKAFSGVRIIFPSLDQEDQDNKIRTMYVDGEKRVEEIAESLGIGSKKVYYRLKKTNVPMRPRGKRPKRK